MIETVVYLVATMTTLSALASVNNVICHLQSDTDFIAIDMTKISLPEASTKGIEPSPFILWYDRADDRFLTWIMTLDGETGAQLGKRLEVYLPPGHLPADVLWSTHFSQTTVRGLEPTPFILFQDYLLYTFSVSYSSDGTPMAEEPTSFSLPVEPEVYGYATCLSEIRGSEFIDEKARLFVGTEFGFVVVLMEDALANIVVDEVISISEVPIIDLETISQYGYVSLGVLTNNMIYGIDPETKLYNGRPSTRYSVVYLLSDPRPTTLSDVEVFGAVDEALADPADMVHLVLADGTSDLALTEITAMQNGGETLTVRLDPMSYPIKSTAYGSLLMLQANGSGISYDPAYSETGGSSSCQVDITDDINDSCSYPCGDCNDDGNITFADALWVKNYYYQTPPGSPAPIGQGDVNLDGFVNFADALYIKNYYYQTPPGFPEPCNPP